MTDRAETREKPPRISVIEQMAAKHHECGGHQVFWDRLSTVARNRLIDAMEASVEVIPDSLMLKHGVGTATVVDEQDNAFARLDLSRKLAAASVRVANDNPELGRELADEARTLLAFVEESEPAKSDAATSVLDEWSEWDAAEKSDVAL